MTSPAQIADQLIAAVETGNLELASSLYAEDAALWQNTTAKTSTKEQALKIVGWLHKTIQNLHYENVQRQVWEDGFAQQHTLCGTTPSGAELVVHACMIVQLKDGKIQEVREYMDSRAFDVMK